MNRIDRIVKAASFAPSGDNCQPWRYVWDGKSLHIRHDENRARHSFNRANHASYLSLGCVLESITIAARKEGLTAVAHYSPHQLEKEPYVVVEFEVGPDHPDNLFLWLFLRSTDRRLYRGGNIYLPLFQTLKKEANEFQGTGLYFQNHFSVEFLSYLHHADEFLWRHKNAHGDLFRWLRFNKRQLLASRDGMSLKNLGVSAFEAPLFKKCKNFKVQKLLNKLGFLRRVKSKTQKWIDSSAGLGCITVKSNRVEELVEAGGLWFRTWCRLNQNGYGVQPMTSATLPLYAAVTNRLPAEHAPYFPEFQNIDPILALFRNTFNFGEGEIPVVLFRTGESKPLPPSHRTLRQPLSQIFKEVKTRQTDVPAQTTTPQNKA